MNILTVDSQQNRSLRTRCCFNRSYLHDTRRGHHNEVVHCFLRNLPSGEGAFLREMFQSLAYPLGIGYAGLRKEIQSLCTWPGTMLQLEYLF